ncbi:hypothetical protein MKQ68_01700 [Chitinophaga horti]|uniref:Uncharacterized protein n=1 Tax=Chitinophaga horti TaxID=2920382 RepID=A0ABY6J2L0_9BACT|nr:hypothetical protein [Chitinophaga horti]UYQ93808.1 hypothetical protein MKQ68_01700 [Chitinophaga horti]
MKEKIKDLIYNFFVESADFNGIPLRTISETLQIEYQYSIDIIVTLVNEGIVSIQSSTNPHIIGFSHYAITDQVYLLQEAKNTTVKTEQYGEIIFSVEQTEYPICLYPTPHILEQERDLGNYEGAVYTKQLALAKPQLEPVFFDIDV